jgi:hypothetical protein
VQPIEKNPPIQVDPLEDELEARCLSISCDSQSIASLLNRVLVLLNRREVMHCVLVSGTTSKERKGFILIEYYQQPLPLDVFVVLCQDAEILDFVCYLCNLTGADRRRRYEWERNCTV